MVNVGKYTSRMDPMGYTDFGGGFRLNLYPSLRTSSNPPPGYGLRSKPLEAHPSLRPERPTKNAAGRRRVGKGAFQPWGGPGVFRKKHLPLPLNGGPKW